jgi:hypothetical protein
MTAIIQSIQPFTISVTTATSVNSVAITAVNTSNSFILPLGANNAATNINQCQWLTQRFSLASSVLVSAFRTSAAVATATTVNGVVIEFANFVNSIQQGVISVTTATTGGTAAINAVSTLAFVVYQGSALAKPTTNFIGHSGVTLENSTLVRAVTPASSFEVQIGYAVVDLTSDLVESVQQIDLSAATTSTVDTATIASVDLSRSLLIDGGMVTSVAIGNIIAAGYTKHIAGATSVQFIRASSVDTGGRRHFATVVQLQAQALATTVQRNSIAITTAGLTATSTIAAVSTRAFLNTPLNHTRASSGATIAGGGIVWSLASTLVTVARLTTANNYTVRYEVAEWASSIALAPGSTSVGSGLVYGNLLSGHVRSPVNRANYIMQESV